jgi:hypothetical protein
MTIKPEPVHGPVPPSVGRRPTIPLCCSGAHVGRTSAAWHRFTRAVITELDDPGWLVRRRSQGDTIRQLASELECSPSTFTLPSRSTGFASAGQRSTMNVNEAWLRTQYIESRRTARSIAQELRGP